MTKKALLRPFILIAILITVLMVTRLDAIEPPVDSSSQLNENVSKLNWDTEAILDTWGQEEGEEANSDIKTPPIISSDLLINTYHLIAWEVFDEEGLYNEVEIEEFIAEGQKAFNMYYITMDIKNGLMYYVSKADGTFRTKDLVIADNSIIAKACKDCKDSKYRIVHRNSESLMLDVDVLHEGKQFVFRLSLEISN